MKKILAILLISLMMMFVFGALAYAGGAPLPLPKRLGVTMAPPMALGGEFSLGNPAELTEVAKTTLEAGFGTASLDGASYATNAQSFTYVNDWGVARLNRFGAKHSSDVVEGVGYSATASNYEVIAAKKLGNWDIGGAAVLADNDTRKVSVTSTLGTSSMWTKNSSDFEGRLGVNFTENRFKFGLAGGIERGDTEFGAFSTTETAPRSAVFSLPYKAKTLLATIQYKTGNTTLKGGWKGVWIDSFNFETSLPLKTRLSSLFLTASQKIKNFTVTLGGARDLFGLAAKYESGNWVANAQYTKAGSKSHFGTTSFFVTAGYKF